MGRLGLQGSKMARKIKGYVRPEFVTCHLCGGEIEVCAKGRIPDAHPACANARDMMRAAVKAMSVAITGVARERAFQLKSTIWHSGQGDFVRLFNVVANPNLRRS